MAGAVGVVGHADQRRRAPGDGGVDAEHEGMRNVVEVTYDPYQLHDPMLRLRRENRVKGMFRDWGALSIPVGITSSTEGSMTWGATGPGDVASRTPSQCVGASGARQREDPTGGRAKGTPRKATLARTASGSRLTARRRRTGQSTSQPEQPPYGGCSDRVATSSGR